MGSYILEDKGTDKTIAYYCLLNDKIELDPDEKSKWNKLNLEYVFMIFWKIIMLFHCNATFYKIS